MDPIQHQEATSSVDTCAKAAEEGKQSLGGQSPVLSALIKGKGSLITCHTDTVFSASVQGKEVCLPDLEPWKEETVQDIMWRRLAICWGLQDSFCPGAG